MHQSNCRHQVGPESRRCSTALTLIVGAAVVLRVAAAFYLGDDVIPEPGIYDQISYDALAQRVLSGYGFSFGEPWWPMTAADAPTAHWSFPYTLYLTAVYAIFGHHPLAARLIQGLIAGALMPILTYRMGRRAFGQAAGLVAAGISAVYVYFFYYGASLMTETFFILALLFSLDLAAQLAAGEKSGPPWWALLGVALGSAVLLRQAFLLVVPLILAWLLITGAARSPSGLGDRRRSFRVHLALMALPLIVVALMILPWTIRNERAFGKFVLLNTNAGFAFYWANHPVHGTSFMSILPPEISYRELIPNELRGLDEAAMERALLQRGIQFVLDDPWRYLLLSLSRLEDQFRFWPSAESGWLSNLSRVGSFGLFLPFMIYGTWLALRPPWFRGLRDWLRTPPALWLGCVGLYTLIHLASWAYVRYRLPTDAVMIIFAGLALTQIGSKLFGWHAESQCRQ